MSVTAVQKKRRTSFSADAEPENLAPGAQLLVKRLSEKGKIPTRGSALAAGYDLYRYASGFVNL
jgi:dUTP pyrophosphatase